LEQKVTRPNLQHLTNEIKILEDKWYFENKNEEIAIIRTCSVIVFSINKYIKKGDNKDIITNNLSQICRLLKDTQ